VGGNRLGRNHTLEVLVDSRRHLEPELDELVAPLHPSNNRVSLQVSVSQASSRAAARRELVLLLGFPGTDGSPCTIRQGNVSTKPPYRPCDAIRPVGCCGAAAGRVVEWRGVYAHSASNVVRCNPTAFSPQASVSNPVRHHK
jgi:hypothetical protein